MAQGINLTISDLPYSEAGIKTFARLQRNSGTTALNAVRATYNLESQDCTRFLGKTVTLSAYTRVGANFTSSGIRMVLLSGTGTDEAQRNGLTNETNLTDIYGRNTPIIPNSTLWSRTSTTFIVPSDINQLIVSLYMAPSGTAGINEYFDITGVQLELGSVATPFEVRPYPVELQLCQRYYVKDTYTLHGGGVSISNVVDTIIGIYYKYPTTMRTAPILAFLGTPYRSGATRDAEQITPLYFIWGRQQYGGGTGTVYAYAPGGCELTAEL
jgi:hypothetical protein